MTTLVSPQDTATLLQDTTPRQPHWQALADILAGRPTYDQINATPYEGPRHEAARRAAFDPILRRTSPEDQITSVYRLLRHIAEQLIENPHEDSDDLYRHAEHRLETCSCLPAGAGVSVGPGRDKWPSLRTSDGRARRRCRHFKTCPWCFYRRFLDLYDRILRDLKTVSAFELAVDGHELSANTVRRSLAQEMWHFTYPTAWVRVWPDLSDLEQGVHPLRALLITGDPKQLTTPTHIPCTPLRLIDRIDPVEFVQRHLPELYRFDQHALPFRDHSFNALAYQRRVYRQTDVTTVFSSLDLARG